MQIHTLDLEFQGVANSVASYLVVGPQGPVLVETGPASTLPTLQQRLREQGFAVNDIAHVLVTHIHLDHAGAAGWWTHQGARVYVHRVGARHLIDPSRLLKSAQRIYGRQMHRLWGNTQPALEHLVTPIDDDARIEVGGLVFRAIDTPGHAGHHHAYVLDRIAFTGDVAGLRLPGQPLVGLPAPPPEFDLSLWLDSINKLKKLPLTTLYPTHFGCLEGDVDDHWRRLRHLLLKAVAFVRQRMEAGVGRREIVKQYQDWNRQRALQAGLSGQVVESYRISNPTKMSVDGILRYWKKQGLPSPSE